MPYPGPRNAFSRELHAAKYRSVGESFDECVSRVAGALADGDAHYHALREVLGEMRFLPGGRIQAAIGSSRGTTPYNCFVSGTIADSFVEGDGSIMQRATEAAQTMRLGGGIGYDFSTLRPRGAHIHRLESRSSGPVAFMEIFDAVCRVTSSAGNRRGAQMGVLRVDHPDVEEFVHAKQNTDKLTGFNISVGVTDAFMRAVEQGDPFDLVFEGRTFRTIDARALWNTIMRSNWDWAEPGVLFLDRINSSNDLAYCETIAATNPCGEQPLPPFGACLLGSFNLVQYLRFDGSDGDGGSKYRFDADAFDRDVATVVRAMDNVVDRATYPLEEQRREALAKRRVGLGVTGLANCVETLGHPYGTPAFLEEMASILVRLRDGAFAASTGLAREKGAFPLFDAERYGCGGFLETLPDELVRDVRRHGIRNSHLLSIAPTGTISLCADNVSSGIEPVFEYEAERRVLLDAGETTVVVRDHAFERFGVRGRVAADVSPDEHVDVLCTAQRYVDSAVSKTCNVPADTDWAAFADLYFRAWRGGAKGCTTYRVGGRREGVLRPVHVEEREAACRLVEGGRRECD
ncbi:MAG: adenosylcobalamin-dependent ribonucleoside-diphosphate reductase [Planctomycetota bacterium]